MMRVVHRWKFTAAYLAVVAVGFIVLTIGRT